MVSFGNRIRELGKRIGKEEQEIAKDLGLTKSQLSHYINGRRKVPSDLLQLIVDKYNVNPQFLFREDAPLYSVDKVKEKKVAYMTSSEYHYLPTAISAGLPIEVEAITEAEKIRIPDNLMGKWAGHKDIFITKIFGDSMNKTMPDGSIIAVKPTPLENLKDGDIVVYSIDHDYSVKRLIKQADRLVFRPHSTENCFTDQIVNIENNELLIHGKVVLYMVEMD